MLYNHSSSSIVFGVNPLFLWGLYICYEYGKLYSPFVVIYPAIKIKKCSNTEIKNKKIVYRIKYLLIYLWIFNK